MLMIKTIMNNKTIPPSRAHAFCLTLLLTGKVVAIASTSAVSETRTTAACAVEKKPED